MLSVIVVEKSNVCQESSTQQNIPKEAGHLFPEAPARSLPPNSFRRQVLNQLHAPAHLILHLAHLILDPLHLAYQLAVVDLVLLDVALELLHEALQLKHFLLHGLLGSLEQGHFVAQRLDAFEYLGVFNE